MSRSTVFDYLNDQTDIIRLKRSLKLNSLRSSLPNIPFPEIIEHVYQYINAFEPPLEIERITLASNGLDSLPSNFKLLTKSLLYLDLHNNNFHHVPPEIYDLENLEYLDFSNNKLSHLLRSRMRNLSNLKLISLHSNQFRYLPPVLGELHNLNLIEVLDNPLILPLLEVIQKFQNQLAELDWVKELKSYLVQNAYTIESKIYDQSLSQNQSQQGLYPSQNQSQSLSQQPLASQSLSQTLSKSTAPLTRNKNISETKTKASKAARRMGLIIKKPDEVSAENHQDDIPPFPNSSSSIDSSFNLVSPPIAVGTTTVSTIQSSQSSSQSSQSSPPVTPTLTGPRKSRSRSNTLLEIDKMLENTESVDTEHKSGAYFRRLLTLAEVPMDETIRTKARSNPGSNPASRNGSFAKVSNSSSETEEDASGTLSINTTASINTGNTSTHSRTQSIGNLGKTPPTLKTFGSTLSDNSPKKWENDPMSIVGVSRKILFAFSELHSSVRRFSGFCTDKKVAIKMVSYLYTAKTNIDTLVESLELVEESSGNTDKIVDSLHTCILSFKQIMGLLGENFQSFVSKIDVCFIRMLYLTLYGSFNEVFNAYKILVPSLKQEKPKILSINTNIENEEVDSKLYDSIEIASSKALDVFGELTRAINKSAVASANNEDEHNISPQVASKVKELTAVCVSSMEIIRRIKTKLITIRNNPSFTTKKLFWDDINLFLKAIIQTFSSVKILMKDLPILNEIRSSMSTLTKSTKDVTILLEASSYKSMSSDTTASSHPPLSSIPSVTNIFTPLSAHPSTSHVNITGHSHSQLNLSLLNNVPMRTPLVAALGPAAQAILPLNGDHQSSLMHQSPMASPGLSDAPATAPAQSSGQYYANNGMNPFDGLIMAKEKESR